MNPYHAYLVSLVIGREIQPDLGEWSDDNSIGAIERDGHCRRSI